MKNPFLYLRNVNHWMAVFCLLFFIASCSSNDDTIIDPDGNGNNGNTNTENVNANVGVGIQNGLEVPALKPGNLYVPHSTNYNGAIVTTYSLEYDLKMRHSRWVAFTFTNTTAAKNWNRNNWNNTEWGGDPFQADKAVPEGIRTELED